MPERPARRCFRFGVGLGLSVVRRAVDDQVRADDPDRVWASCDHPAKQLFLRRVCRPRNVYHDFATVIR